MSSLVKWLEAHQLPCPVKQTFGVDCPGCGSQTAIIELLKGNFTGSFHAYPALIPLLLMLLALIIHILFKIPKGAAILKILFIFTSLIIIAGYFVKMLTH
ncbi:MAG: DUF2752 domain-containing protein [Bacteroidetes bacterium]|nr:DUF2752 domain-containing protein [Bacteroidota bacterium]